MPASCSFSGDTYGLLFCFELAPGQAFPATVKVHFDTTGATTSGNYHMYYYN